MTNCSAHQREKKEEITLYIEGWALIEPTGSGSCLLQHLSNRNHHRSLKQLPCPSSAQESCSWGDKKLNSQPTYLLQVPLCEMSWSIQSEKLDAFCHGEQHQEKAEHKEHTSHPPDSTPSALHLCGCCQPIPSPALMVPCLESSCLLRWSLLPSLQYEQNSKFLIHSMLSSPVCAPTLSWMNLGTENF